VNEGDTTSANLEFEVVAAGPPRRLDLAYTLSDLTASAAGGDYTNAAGVVSLTPRPARLVAHWGAGELDIPGGVAIAPNGDILVAGAGQVVRFSRDGDRLQAFGRAEFLVPRGVAVGPGGEVHVANSTGWIHVYDAAGRHLRSWGHSAWDPYGLAVDATGSVYMSEPRYNRVQKFDRYGNSLATWYTTEPGEVEYDGPLGIAVDAQGDIYLMKPNGRIYKFTSAFAPLATWSDTRGTCIGAGLHVDASGNLLIADGASSRVVVLDDQGVFLSEWTLDQGPPFNPGEFSATGIVSDGDGNVYVGSRFSSSVAHFRWDRSEGTIVVPVACDTNSEPDETLQLQLSSHPHATLADAIAIGTIVNDDVRPGEDVPPVLEAVARVAGTWTRDVVVEVTARDPEGTAIAALEADLSALPGASFTVKPDRRRGTLRWRPRFVDVRDEPHVVTFTARNALVASTATQIHVGSNLILNPSFSVDLAGWAPHVGATLTRTPGGRRDGHAVRLGLPGVPWSGITDSPNWASPLGGGYRVVIGAWVRAGTNPGDARLQVREYQGGALLATSTVEVPLTPAWRRVMLAHSCVASGESDLDLTIDAQGGAGDSLDLDDVSIVATDISPTLDVPLAPRASLSASVFPNPARGHATFEVSLPADDCLRVELYDLFGRQRAVLADGSLIRAGARRFEIRDHEGRLSPGVYWYRAWTPSVSLSGRVVLLP
jgi:hypothetical protein